jgi:hypothetical protein
LTEHRRGNRGECLCGRYHESFHVLRKPSYRV